MEMRWTIHASAGEARDESAAQPAQLALTAICGVLSIILGYMLLAPLPDIPQPAIQAHADPVDDAPPARFEAPPKQAFVEVDDRSVFNPLRVRVSGPSEPGAANTNSLPPISRWSASSSTATPDSPCSSRTLRRLRWAFPWVAASRDGRSRASSPTRWA